MNRYGQSIYMLVTSVKVDSPLVINKANYSPVDINLYPYYTVCDAGEIYITKLDTLKKIVSGRFKFIGKSTDWDLKLVGNDSIVITDGRFDLKLSINN